METKNLVTKFPGLEFDFVGLPFPPLGYVSHMKKKAESGQDASCCAWTCQGEFDMS
jgi:hypothetical protein